MIKLAITRFICLVSISILFISGLSHFLYAHGAGGGIDKNVDNYTIDFGYNEKSTAINEPLLMSFGLFNKSTGKFVQFDSAPIRISNDKGGLVFRGKINPAIPGRITLAYAFTEEGIYTIEVAFIREKKTIVEAPFELVMGSPKNSFSSLLAAFFTKPFSSLLNKNKQQVSNESTTSISYSSVKEHVVEGMKSCVGGDYQCYSNLAADISSNYETEDILEALSKTENIAEVFSQCHQLTHYLGRNEFRESRSISDSYSVCTPVCWGGCYHGAMEQYFWEKGIQLYTDDSSEISKEIVHACGKQEDYENSRIFFECLHGIGHAMMFITDGDLPYSLLLCDSLENGQKRVACYGGAFMESSSSSTSHPSKFIKEDDPMYPCNMLDERYLETCYAYQSSHFARISRFNWTEVGILCGKVPEKYSLGCFEVIGSNQIGSYMEPKRFLETCNIFGNKENRQSCYQGILSGLAGRYKEEHQRMIDFCNLVSEDEKQFCFTTMGMMMRQWSHNQENFQPVCRALGNYSNQCLKGLGSADKKPPLILERI